MSIFFSGNEIRQRKGIFYPSVTTPYVPNYPPGLSGISGLVGWYDSSQPTSLLDETGNPVVNGSNVANWQNLFNGATQGAYVTPTWYQDTDGNYPTFSTSQKYQYNQSTGTAHNGVWFNINDPNQGNPFLKWDEFATATPPTILTWFYTSPVILNAINQVVALADSETANFFDITQSTGNSAVGKGTIQNFVSGTYYINGTNTGSSNIINSLAQCGYVDATNASNIRVASVYKDSSGLQINGTTNQAFTSFSSQAKSTGVAYDAPWSLMQLGTDTQGTFFSNPAPIGELLIYANVVLSAANVTTIMNYLITKWQ